MWFYAFLSQVVTWADADLEMLYVFARLLLRRLPLTRDELPLEVQRSIDIESYRIQRTSTGRISLDAGEGELQPIGAEGGIVAPPPEPDSQIIQHLNARFGTEFGDTDRVTVQHLISDLEADLDLRAIVRENAAENARVALDPKADARLQQMMDSNERFYRQVNENPEFKKASFAALFERYRQDVAGDAL